MGDKKTTGEQGDTSLFVMTDDAITFYLNIYVEIEYCYQIV